MTKHEAYLEAHRRWSQVSAGGIGTQSAWVSIRRKNVENRFQVGYLEVLSVDFGTGEPNWYKTVVLGTGPSWEAAFDSATRGAL